MFNRNAKRQELRSALQAGDPHAIARVLLIARVNPRRQQSSPPTLNSPKEALQANGVDFGTVAKLFLDASEYAAHVR
jgi:hypothetical protein